MSSIADIAKEFLSRGYVVYDVLSPEDVPQLANIAMERVQNILLQGHKDSKLLIDHQLRMKTLELIPHFDHVPGTGIDPLLRHNLKTTPVYSKYTGMINSYLAPWIVRLHLCKRVREVVSLLYDTGGLHLLLEDKRLDVFLSHLHSQPVAYTRGLGRYSMKVTGTSDDDRHLDRALYSLDYDVDCPLTIPDVKSNRVLSSEVYSESLTRINTVLVSSIDTTKGGKDCGGLEVLERFHLYWKVISLLLRDQRIGGEDMWKLDEMECRIDLGVRFSNLLPWLNEQLAAYTKIYNAMYTDSKEDMGWEVRPELAEVCMKLINTEGMLPWCPTVFQPLVWTIIQCRAGQAISWDTRLPYRSCRNKSTIPAILHYFPLCIVQKAYYCSPLHNRVRMSLSTGKYGDNINIEKKVDRWNREEQDWMNRHPTEWNEYVGLLENLEITDAQLLCLRPYSSEQVV